MYVEGSCNGDPSAPGPRLEEMIQSGEVTWPVKIGLKELQLALIAAHDSGKVQLHSKSRIVHSTALACH